MSHLPRGAFFNTIGQKPPVRLTPTATLAKRLAVSQSDHHLVCLFLIKSALQPLSTGKRVVSARTHID